MLPECSFHVEFMRVSTYVGLTRGKIQSGNILLVVGIDDLSSVQKVNIRNKNVPWSSQKTNLERSI